mmetsp:Transcript_9434/g.23489  ORF Transcript_9434/g.23489 Transcript_9434/m.23489 type:complete len:291 (+) Transcript_9434:294-1166(+)|eukprot:CAMPEP_0197591486 /NCGR_PEP_ID=MMETSP1326-20131121/13409_1 /TAXON_ID=1155430 /ORGANISM="Genus nov. species nov., Strain RCC2288" /LENGTH=290 /DNA_ID=CAMNT_0043156963 /DNA_START=190 /DNA_END=1062 /DNA_ORIENTATION=-
MLRSVLRFGRRAAACELRRPSSATPLASSLRNLHSHDAAPRWRSSADQLGAARLPNPPATFALSGLHSLKKARCFGVEPGHNNKEGGAGGGEEGVGGAATGADGEAEEGEWQQAGEVNHVEMEALRAEVIERTAFAKDLNDRLLRTMADMENLRERTRRQAEDSKKFAIQGFCKDLLDVSDNLSRAASTVKPEVVTAEADAEKVKAMLFALHDGVLMVENIMLKTFGKHGVEKFDPAEGDAFDPNSHMGLFQIPDGTKEAGTIGAVTKVGFSLHGRIIRPAEVGVYVVPE